AVGIDFEFDLIIDPRKKAGRSGLAGWLFLLLFLGGARSGHETSGVRQERRQFVFPARSVEPSHLYRNIVEPAGPEALVEMPQARNEHAHHGHLDIGPGLVEHEEIVTCAPGDLDAGFDLLLHAVERNIHAEW